MKRFARGGLAAVTILTAAAAVASAQYGRPPARYWLGLIDSRPAGVELGPGDLRRGLEILGVTPGGPAARSGLEAGDVVLEANGVPVASPDGLRRVLSGSGGRLRLFVLDVRTRQVGDVAVILDPVPPGAGVLPGPAWVTVTGRLRLGIAAVGGETTGTTLTTQDGTTYDLDFAAGSPPDARTEGRSALVSGLLRVSPGPERPGRRIIRVGTFRLLDAGPVPPPAPTGRPRKATQPATPDAVRRSAGGTPGSP